MKKSLKNKLHIRHCRECGAEFRVYHVVRKDLCTLCRRVQSVFRKERK